MPTLSRRTLLVSGAALFADRHLASSQAQDQLDPAARRKIGELIGKALEEKQIPGMSVAIGRKGNLLWQTGHGLADIENETPMTPATMCRIASISKPITAMAALSLWEEGKLDLDAPVQKYVPSFPNKAWPVSTRQLLSHLGGIRHYKGSEITSNRHYGTLQGPLAIFKDDPLVHQPGTKYLYSTYGYNLAGAAAEATSGLKFMDLLRARVFGPSGTTAIRDDDHQAIIRHRAQGYELFQGKLRNSEPVDTSNKIPGGGLISTAADLVRIGMAAMDSKLLKAATREMMWTPQKLTDGSLTTYGLGWNVSTKSGRLEVGHSGGQPRVSTGLALIPDLGVAVAVLTNLEGAPAMALARDIATAAGG